MIAISDVCCFSEELDTHSAPELFKSEATEISENLQTDLSRTYLGKDLPKLKTPKGSNWKTCLELDLTQTTQLSHFQIQGAVQAPQITTEGLRITTPEKQPAHDFSILDLNHVYLWSREWYEGDIHISYEFCNLKRGGLSLLMTQCSGMQREDFMKVHKPRTNGIMRPVCWEDIRNYHWEYFREMNDVRNDVASHALLKNPWFRPLGFGVHGPLYEIGTWHRLDFIQEGERIQCAIDKDVIIDTLDKADDNNGPVLSAGRFAIRCMTRTDILLRNLVVRNRRIFDE